MFRLVNRHILILKAVIHAINLGFMAILVWNTVDGVFGADPIEGITHYTGIAALNVLFITMLVTPVARFTRQGLLVRCRRLVGLYCFSWSVLHMLTYAVLDLELNVSLLGMEIIDRPYLTIGALCWVILLLLAVTSTQAIQRKMGRKWQQLHNGVYLVTMLAPIHFYWSVKSGLTDPIIYIAIGVLLLVSRWRTLKRLVVKTSRS